MSEHNITVEGGTSVRLKTAGKYCDRDIVVAAEGGGDTSIEDGLVTRTLTTYSNHRVTSIGAEVFRAYSKLTSVDLPNVKSIGSQAFYSCSGLTVLSLPSLTSMGASSIRSCTKLTSINLPNLASSGTHALAQCSALTEIVLPSLPAVVGYLFYSCSALAKIDLPIAKSVATYAFNGCKALTALILRNTTLATLSATTAFTSTPIASGTGYIYIPAALVDSYKAATNWSTYADQIRALEDYTVDGTITGELDETKI